MACDSFVGQSMLLLGIDKEFASAHSYPRPGRVTFDEIRQLRSKSIHDLVPGTGLVTEGATASDTSGSLVSLPAEATAGGVHASELNSIPYQDHVGFDRLLLLYDYKVLITMSTKGTNIIARTQMADKKVGRKLLLTGVPAQVEMPGTAKQQSHGRMALGPSLALRHTCDIILPLICDARTHSVRLKAGPRRANDWVYFRQIRTLELIMCIPARLSWVIRNISIISLGQSEITFPVCDATNR